MKERWLSVVGFPGYEISNLGRIASYRRGSRSLLNPHRNRNDLAIHLSRNGKRHTRKIHRLVLEAFIGPCPPGMECRHLNGVKRDDRLENLAWGTHVENIRDQFHHGTFRFAPKMFGEHNPQSKLTDAEVDQLRREASLQRDLTPRTLRSLGRKYGISAQQVKNIVTRRSRANGTKLESYTL